MKTTKSAFLEAARIEARTAFMKDVIYRRWNADHGGVYVPVTEAIQPNPYLDVPERDITTPLGIKLTKINPAYMTRQVYELARESYNVRGHITSLNPIRPANAPDPWEEKALKSFQNGLKEVSSIEEMEGGEYMRLMQPLLTEEGCLKCHALQGYKIGDIRGGISVSIPMAPHMEIVRSKTLTLYILYGFLWLVGFVGIGIGMGHLNQQIQKRKANEAALQKEYDFSQNILNTAQAIIVVLDPAGNIISINPFMEELSGYRLDEVRGKEWFSTFLPERDRDVVREFFTKAVGGIQTKGNVNPIVLKDGSQRNIEWNDRTLKDPHGEVIGLLTIGQDITEQKKTEQQKDKLISDLQTAIQKVKQLSGLLPICSHCKKIRDDKGYWKQIEEYIHDHSDAEFSHGMCPKCSDELYGKEDWYIEMKKEENQNK
ncbi:c-type heme family protein [Desulfobacula sp.]